MYNRVEQPNKINSFRLTPFSNWLRLCGIARFNACDSMQVSCYLIGNSVPEYLSTYLDRYFMAKLLFTLRSRLGFSSWMPAIHVELSHVSYWITISIKAQGTCEDEWYMYYYALPLLIVLTVLIVLIVLLIVLLTSWGGGKPPPQGQAPSPNPTPV